MTLPTTMNALWYKGPGNYEVKQVPIPQYGDYDILVKGMFVDVQFTHLFANHESIQYALAVNVYPFPCPNFSNCHHQVFAAPTITSIEALSLLPSLCVFLEHRTRRNLILHLVVYRT